LYGAGWSRGFHTVKGSIILDLADVVKEPKVMFWNMEVPEELNDRYATNCKVIRIEWVDGGVPTLSPLFWHKLADFLERENKPVIVCCMGGHGRTGTALAILAGIYRLNGNADIGEWIRSRHCANAIETTPQVAYVEEVTGLRTVIQGSWAKEISQWKNWRKSITYDEDCTFADNCDSQDCGNCKDYGLLDDDRDGDGNHPLVASDQKVLGYFDKNDVYHTGYPSQGAEVLCTVSQDSNGNDVFEYVYDATTDDFLPSY
jgi:hypothetical protein